MLMVMALTPEIDRQAYGQTASASEVTCHHLAALTESLLAKTLWYQSKTLVHQPFFNAAILKRFLRLSDEMKLYYTESQVKEMMVAGEANITKLFHHHNNWDSPPPLKDKADLTCDFIHKTHEIFLQTAPDLQQIIFELITEDSDFTLNHTLSLKAPDKYAQNMDGLRERWSKRIKLEKLVMAEQLFGYEYPDAASTQAVKDALLTQYKKLWRVRTSRYAFYWHWLKALFHVIDSGASFLTRLQPSKHAVYISTCDFTSLDCRIVS